MKIKLGQCRCRAIVYLAEEAGLSWTADMEALDAQEATQALLAGRELYQVRRVSRTVSKLYMTRPDVLKALNGPVDDRPFIVRSHGCPTGAVSELVTAEQKGGGPGAPKGGGERSAAPSRPSSGATRSAVPAPTAVSHPSDPACDACRQLCTPGTYVGVAYDGRWMWVSHTACP